MYNAAQFAVIKYFSTVIGSVVMQSNFEVISVHDWYLSQYK